MRSSQMSIWSITLCALALITWGCDDGADPGGAADANMQFDGFGAGGSGGSLPLPLPISDAGQGGQGGQGGGQGGQGGGQGGQGGQGGGQGGQGGGQADAGFVDTWCNPPAEQEICHDDIDNNCDGLVDEGCTCQAPEKSCYTGNPRELEVENSGCRAGTQACRLEFYGPCEGEIGPSEEICDGIDNDCNGQTDELEDCVNEPPVAICPPDQSGVPLANYDFQGGYEDPDGDAMVRATWTILQKPGGSTSVPEPPDRLRTTIFADLQGEYVLQFEVEDARGGIGRCTTTLTTVTNDGLRIEMVWNVGAANDTSDVDMHLLRSPDGAWFDAGRDGDDCFFLNCKICDSNEEQVCRDLIAEYNQDPNRDPPPQVEWSFPLSANDPRLDLDDVQGNGPENINILSPSNGTVRLGVHYWDDDGFGASTVTLRIFCGGVLAHEFDPVVLQAMGTHGEPTTEFWEVADIAWFDDGCQVQPLGERGCQRICQMGEIVRNGEHCAPNMERGNACN